MFRHHSKWSADQKERAILLFKRYAALQKAYGLAAELGQIYERCRSKEQAFKHLALWYNKVEASGIATFRTVARSIQLEPVLK